MIAGALKYSRYPLPLRWLMKRIAAKAGGDTDTSRDYEYTDWAQVEAYARRLADACEMNCYKTVHR
jgi:menaquinone-dependent protoporphyrinogen oxidase